MSRAISRILLAALVAGALVACAPEVGSERWCAKMRDTPKADWSANDATAYAKHCIFKAQDDD